MSRLTNTDHRAEEVKAPFGGRGGQHVLATLVDHSETYGLHVIQRFAESLSRVETAIDIGAGLGRDLRTIKCLHPHARAVAIEAGSRYAAELMAVADEVHVLNIERDPLPFADGSVDLIIANQILEHLKEIFWVFHEVSRSLRVGGHLIVGVPNIASLHNRLLLLFGAHPTQHKLCSAHVRPFSQADTLRFLEACFPGGYHLEKFAGSQFYPFPGGVARVLAKIFPTGSFSIFFLLRKQLPYKDGFATYPSRAKLESNFWTGNVPAESQYWEGASP